MYELSKTTSFKKDFKRIVKRGWDIYKLEELILLLIQGKNLPAKYNLHPLVGNYVNHFDCHIESDWLLIFKIDKRNLLITLIRTGTHSDIF